MSTNRLLLKYPFKPSHSANALKLMELGLGKPEVAKSFKVPLQVLDLWSSEIEDFKDALELGETYCYAWWLEQGHLAVHDKGFNQAAWFMQMKNRFGWVDKQEIKSKVDLKASVKTFAIARPKEDAAPIRQLKIVD